MSNGNNMNIEMNLGTPKREYNTNANGNVIMNLGPNVKRSVFSMGRAPPKNHRGKPKLKPAKKVPQPPPQAGGSTRRRRMSRKRSSRRRMTRRR